MQSKPRILIADDDTTSRHLLASRLRQVGYDTSEVSCGEDALEVVQQTRPDLLILDVLMPRLDGFATLQALRQTHSSTDLPVIMLTSLDGPGDVVEALRLGANDYSVKPLDFAKLLPRVETHVRLKTTSLRLGKYELHALIGSGSAGSVYAARDCDLDRPAAVKVLLRQLTIDRTTVQHFLQEAALMAKVKHPNVVRLFDSGQEGETYYLAMELVRGTTLEHAVAKAPFTVMQAVELARQVASALNELHQHGIVHRDIKPQNILLADGIAKITDFGIALDLADSNRARASVGSLLYASPQQLLGQPDLRSDMYALGSTLFFALTGRPPFADSLPMAELFERKFAPPPMTNTLNPAVPAPFNQLIAQLMAPAPKQRFASDRQLLNELERLG